MSENAFKNWINPQVVEKIASELKKVHPPFKHQEFILISTDLSALELKARVQLLTKKLKSLLPDEYPEALRIMTRVMENDELKSFELWPFSEYISQFGLDHFDESMKAMHLLTQKFTAEFAIRPFLLKNPGKVLSYFKKWARDKNVHVRRWVSEGSRPILPWGGKIPLFIMDPMHTLVLLDQLKFDKELYVRKSVANHLNDITKNHPQVVIQLLKIWEEQSPPEHQEKILWIKRHALRTLIKKGDKNALKLMGVKGEAKVEISPIKLNQKNFRINDVLIFSFTLKSLSQKPQKLVVDYKIDFVKANNKTSSKVFKLKTFHLGPKETVTIKKTHSLKPITTMTYYSGVHHLSIQINGKVFKQVSWDFKP